MSTPIDATLRPETRKRIDRLCGRVAHYLTPGQLAAFREIVEYELHAQDRDTRHACAEAITELESFALTDVRQAFTRAASVAMNTRAI